MTCYNDGLLMLIKSALDRLPALSEDMQQHDKEFKHIKTHSPSLT